MADKIVSLQTKDGPMDAYLALPDKTPAPGLIVIQEAFGVNDHINLKIQKS